MDQANGGDSAGDDRVDRPLPHIRQHAQNDLAAALYPAPDRGAVLPRCATSRPALPPAALIPAGGGRFALPRGAPSRRASQPAPAPGPPLLATAAGWPLWPATT